VALGIHDSGTEKEEEEKKNLRQHFETKDEASSNSKLSTREKSAVKML